MQLSELQKQIMQLWADKSLSFGCICEFVTKQYYDKYIVIYQWVAGKQKVFAEINSLEKDINCFYDPDWDYEIIWHPITYSRLCYLYWSQKNENLLTREWIACNNKFTYNPEYIKQSILERPEELQLLVRDFLLSIQ